MLFAFESFNTSSTRFRISIINSYVLAWKSLLADFFILLKDVLSQVSMSLSKDFREDYFANLSSTKAILLLILSLFD